MTLTASRERIMIVKLKDNTHIWTALLIIVTYVLVQVIPAVVVGILAALFPEQIDLSWTVYSTVFAFALGTVLILAINYQRRFQTPADQPSSTWGQVLLWAVLGLVLLLASQSLSFIIEESVFNISSQSANTQLLLELIQQYPLFILASSLFAPIMEEFVFRKAMYGSLSSATGRVGAAVISSLVFAFIHFDGHILVYSVMGLIFCYLYEKTHSIWTPILAHLLMNSIAVISALFLS